MDQQQTPRRYAHRPSSSPKSRSARKDKEVLYNSGENQQGHVSTEK